MILRGAPKDCRHRLRGARLALASLSLLIAGCTNSALELTSPSPQSPAVSVGGSAASAKIGGPDFAVASDPNVPDLLARPGINRQHSYSLPELIDLAQMNNPVTRAGWIRARQAAIALGAVEATYLPVLSAKVLAGHESTSRPVSGLHAGPVNVPAGTLTAEGAQVIPALTLEWLLFDFGARDAARGAAEELAFASNISFNGMHQKLIHDVAVAYYALAATRAQTAIADNTVANAQVVLDEAQARSDQGLSTVVEVAHARQLVAQAKFDRTQSNGAARSAYQALLSAMGISPTTKIKVTSPRGRRLPRSMPDDIDQLLEASLKRRPDIQAAFARVRAKKQGVAAAKAAFMPKIAVIGSVSQNIGQIGVSDSRFGTNSTLNIDQPNASIMLGVSVPLFDGGLRDARLGAARADVEAARQELAELQNAAASEIVLSYEMLQASLASHAAASELVQAAEVTHDAALGRFRSGLITVADIGVTQTGLLKARLAKTQAYSSSLIAAANLALATGLMTNRLSPQRFD